MKPDERDPRELFAEGERDLRQFLAAVAQVRATCVPLAKPGHAYTCLEDWLLKHGASMTHGAKWTAGELAVIRRLRKQVRPRLKQCFNNCQVALMRCEERLTYCEGYVSSVIPIYHAWLLVDGKLWGPYDGAVSARSSTAGVLWRGISNGPRL